MPARRTTTRLTLRPLGDVHERAAASFTRIVDVLGNNTVADILGVDKSRVSRWKGRGVPAAIQPRVIDLDHLLDRLLLEMTPALAGTWMTSPNAQLGFARPVDVLTLRGVAPVLAALDAYTADSYA